MHFLSLIAPDALPVRRSDLPCSKRREFRRFWRFSTVSGPPIGCGQTNFPAAGNCHGLNAAAAPARPARPSRASAPRRRPARSSRAHRPACAANANRLPLNSTMPAAKLHPATVAGPRRGSRPCASAMTATSAAACTMPYKEPVRSSSAVRGAVSEMRRERARHHRGETRQPGDRQPYPRHLMGSARAARFRTAPASRRRSAARRTRARRGAARPGPSRAAAAGRGPAPRSRGTAPPRLPAGPAARSPRPARPAARSRGIPACRWRRSPARRTRLRAAISAVPRHRLTAAPRSRPRPRPRARPRPGRAISIPGSAASAASARSSSESGLSGSVGPASTSSTAQPLGAQQAHRSDRVQHALAAQHAADQRHPDARPARFRDRLRQRREMRRIDPGTADQDEPRPVYPEPGERLPVLRVLHDDAGAAGGMAQPPRQRRAGQPRRPARGATNPEPSPLTAAMQAGRSARRGNASRSAAPPNSTGFSAT